MNKEIEIWKEKKGIDAIRDVFGRGLSNSEFEILCQIGKATNLNPFLKEIWAVKYGNSPASIFIGRDGYRKVAQDHPDYDYHFSDTVYENDDFLVKEGVVKHGYTVKNRGEIKGAYCIIKRKSSSKSVFNFVAFSEYSTGKSLWEKKPATMIKKVAEAQGLRSAFQSSFSGTFDENEQWEEETETKKGKFENLKKKYGAKREKSKTKKKAWEKWNELLKKKEKENEKKYTEKEKKDFLKMVVRRECECDTSEMSDKKASHFLIWVEKELKKIKEPDCFKKERKEYKEMIKKNKEAIKKSEMAFDEIDEIF